MQLQWPVVLLMTHFDNVLLQHKIKNNVYCLHAGLANYTLHSFKELHC